MSALPSIIEEYHKLSPDWRDAIEQHCNLQLITALSDFVADQRAVNQVYPPAGQVFTALRLCTLSEARVVILGQDPYHGPNQAHGLSFSVNSEIQKIPPSLRNIYKERLGDLGLASPESGDLSGWAAQGVLLLNTVLTVRQAEAHSHRKQGWEQFTDAVIKAISNIAPHVVFILWGRPAQSKRRLIDDRHTCIESVHPSPLSASRGFLGSQPFSRCNQALIAHHQIEIQW